MSTAPVALGLDPGLAVTGYGVVQGTSQRWEVLAGGVIETDSGVPRAERLHDIFSEIGDLIETYQPGGVAVEEVYMATNSRTAMRTSETRGVLLLACAGLRVRGYTPLQVKKRITGYGRANKQQVQAMVKKMLHLPRLPEPDDMADGLALSLCYLIDHQGVTVDDEPYL